jgi:curved DNA-binding protein CbpA
MDFYKVLNISRSASLTEIKTAYRKLAFKFHPDMNLNSKNNAQTVEKFKAITTAYETLTDTTKKKNYDSLIGNNNVRVKVNVKKEYTANDDDDIDRLFRSMRKDSQQTKESWPTWNEMNDSTVVTNIKIIRKNSWYNPNNPHQRYYYNKYDSEGNIKRRNNFNFEEEYVDNSSYNDQSNFEKAAQNLNKKRNLRKAQESKKDNKKNEKDSFCTIS